MPEGPEIRKAADAVEKALQNRKVLDISFAFEALQGYEDLLRGADVTRVDTKGKAMLTRFDNGYTIYSHNQLYGKWMVRNAYNYPNTNRQLRLAIHNEKKSALLYSASDIEVLKDEEVPDHPFIRKIGPDILSEQVTEEEMIERFKSKRFSRRKWTSLLLDQSFVAGLGNYLRSEILFASGIHPSLRPGDTEEDKVEEAARQTIALIQQSYHHKGITVDLDIAERMKSEGKTRNQYRHWVFRRALQPCHICGTKIEKIEAGNRRLYYCPYCQSL
ncbi:endonuclease VIII [Salimicrobium halophilum]|uniref:Formamidopyrimidine-DNA glycosylase n=1 Tax=Salimicrobium halophilum TaxID=86666 RepID=A0A1G8UQ86_9BACI|nr:endonuclease VIII [Salimicrobium halophilum]SDJ55963.1 endonuclease-8 [Salimicrobium halophilum]